MSPQPLKGTMMSTISAVGGASSAWADYSSSRASAMKEKMFAKVDKDGSGGIEKTELQGMLDQVAEKSGMSLGSADDLLGKMDSDGNGSLSQDELDTGMKSLMPAPSSTLEFAQQRSGDSRSAADALFSKLDADSSGVLDADELNTLIDRVAAKTTSGAGGSIPGSVSAEADAAVFAKLDQNGDGSINQTEFEAAAGGRPDGPPPGGGMPPQSAARAGGGGSGADASGSSSADIDPLDTNEDGVVSAQERATGELKELMKALTGAADTDGDKQISQTEATRFVSQFQTALNSTTATQTADDSSSSTDGSSSSGPQGRLELSALRDLVREEYSKAAQNHAQTPALDVAA